MPPAVTVIITTFNRAHLLPDAIHSVLRQTFKDFELLVIDNGSTDNTKDVVKSFCDERINYIVNGAPTGSCAAPRNIGVHKARAAYIAFLDDDDIWYPKKLEICIEKLKTRPEVALVCHAQDIIHEGRRIRTNICGPWSEKMYERLLYERNFLGPGSVVIKRDIIAKIGGFDTRSDYLGCDDYDLWIRLAKKGFIFSFINTPLCEFRITCFNGSNDPYHPIRLAEMIKTHIIGYEGGIHSSSSKGRMASLYFYAAQTLNKFGKRKDALRYYYKTICYGYPGLKRVFSEVFLPLKPSVKPPKLNLCSNS